MSSGVVSARNGCPASRPRCGSLILQSADRAEPVYRPETIIILENKDTAVYSSPACKGIAIEGERAKAPGTLPRLPWITACPRTVYWGEIDAAGLAIVNDLRIAGIQAASILMDYATYEAYKQNGVWTDDRASPCPAHHGGSCPR